MRSLSFVALYASASSAFVYTWPDRKYDTVEGVRWQHLGHNENQISTLITPCNQFLLGPGTGRSNAADWIRTAFHDMAPHDKKAGTGGMDGSIARTSATASRSPSLCSCLPPAQPSHVRVCAPRSSPSLTSNALVGDGIALGAVLAMENCGGPEIPYRHGRVDAKSSNNPGVPEPQQPLSSHIRSFARSGFSKEEMIGLVACGHTFGGVQNKIFPQIVPPLNDPTNNESTHFFDASGFKFDNAVATEYIGGHSKNPLVAGTNDTFNSDKRIFGSDRNKTMAAFARSPQLFAKTCSTLISRMIDTVPKGVKLSDVLEPLPVKPDNIDLVYVGDGTLRLGGEVRIWNNTSPTTKVRMTWTNRDGRTAAANSVQLATNPDLVGTAVNGRYKSAWFTFNRTVEATPITLKEADGIKALSFEVSDSSYSGSHHTYNQGGKGYRIRDEIMWAASTCGSVADPASAGRFDVAIRRDVVDKVARVWVETLEFTNAPGQIHAIDLPRVVQVEIPRLTADTSDKKSSYVVWSASTDGIEEIAKTQPVRLVALLKSGERIDGNGQRIIQGLQPSCSVSASARS
ncbi:heme peroxidase [Auriculariales sp. MPI-PUGE-AT-0066]|nr:heme peroxidase [Auriculariales sp. MPI-PUGE-AT-0066]